MTFFTPILSNQSARGPARAGASLYLNANLSNFARGTEGVLPCLSERLSVC